MLNLFQVTIERIQEITVPAPTTPSLLRVLRQVTEECAEQVFTGQSLAINSLWLE